MTSRLLLMTGTACHRRPRSANQSSSGCSSGTSCTAWLGELEHPRALLDGLDDEREHVEGSPGLGRPPPAPDQLVVKAR